MDDPLSEARRGARYAAWRAKALSRPVLLAVDGTGIACMDAASPRARYILETTPQRVAGVYTERVEREAIVADLLVVLGR